MEHGWHHLFGLFGLQTSSSEIGTIFHHFPTISVDSTSGCPIWADPKNGALYELTATIV